MDITYYVIIVKFVIVKSMASFYGVWLGFKGEAFQQRALDELHLRPEKEPQFLFLKKKGLYYYFTQNLIGYHLSLKP